jgi:Transglutaminase-like superfamily
MRHRETAMSGDFSTDLATRGNAESFGYGIPAHVHMCVTAEGSVLLDLKRDKYFGIGRVETEILATVVQGWPRPSWESIRERNPEWIGAQANELCLSMLESGLLIRTQGGVMGSGAVACRRDMKGDWISVGDELEVHREVTWRHCADFVAAYLWARCSLAWQPFLATVEGVRARKTHRTLEKQPPQVLQVAGTVDVFRRLRPLLFPAEGRCLLHALTLIRFLSKYEFYPEWVIGVTTQPWGAHSWVQWGNYLLDTNPEKVCAYTPILVV